MTDIKLKNYVDGTFKETGEVVSLYSIVHSLSAEDFVSLLDDYLNLGGKQFPEGKRVGEKLQSTHPTLQRCVIGFTLGIVYGLSGDRYTDPRNEYAIQVANKIRQMIDDGELNIGMYI